MLQRFVRTSKNIIVDMGKENKNEKCCGSCLHFNNEDANGNGICVKLKILINCTEKCTCYKKRTCRDCKHRERWEFDSKIIQYCGKRKSGRTFNGWLKIKVTNEACPLFELIKEE